MPERLKRTLPTVSAIAVSVALVCLFVVGRQRHGSLNDTGETRRDVEATVAELQALRPNSLSDPQFLQALTKLNHARYVVAVWLVELDGRIAYSSARFADRGRVEEWATEETQRVLSEMPAGFLTTQQGTALLAASAIQREGEHNDVFRQMIRPLRSSTDTDLGFIGVAYDVSSTPRAFPGYGYAIALLTVPVGLIVYWLALPWWVFLDAKAHGERACVWAMFVLLGNLVALFAYLLARRPVRKTV